MTSTIRDWRRAILRLCVTVLVVAVLGCGPDSSDETATDETPGVAAAQPAADGEPIASGTAAADAWLETVALGREVDTQGAIPEGSRTDAFAPGETIYLSIEVDAAAPQAAVRVTFSRPQGGTVAEDEKKVPAGAGYLYFDSGDTASWEPGAYRVAVAVGGETVRELGFRISG